MRVKSESLQPRHVFSLPNMPGEWVWKSDKWGVGEDLVDGAGVLVAHAKWWKISGDATLDIFVPAGDWLVEFLVIAAAALRADDRKGAKMAVEAVGGLS